MKLRLPVVMGILIMLLAACAAQPASQPTETPAVNQLPSIATLPATQPPPPTEAFTPTVPPPAAAEPALPFQLISTAFEPGGSIPDKYSCDGDDVSPSLAWGDPPAGTQSLALIVEDPDAPGGTFDHWVLFNISPEVRELPEAMQAGTSLAGMATVWGVNSFGRSSYDGPCPPSGTHHYYFRLYALDTTLNLEAGATKEQVLAAMEGHILAQAELMGTYIR
jgi:Raf kinase inhibitor-like YbhB/YbcL family protein